MYKLEELNKKKVSDLKEIAKSLNIPKAEKLLKSDLVYQILDYQSVLPANNTADTKKEDNQQKQRKFRQRKPREEKSKILLKRKKRKLCKLRRFMSKRRKTFKQNPKTKNNIKIPIKIRRKKDIITIMILMVLLLQKAY